MEIKIDPIQVRKGQLYTWSLTALLSTIIIGFIANRANRINLNPDPNLIDGYMIAGTISISFLVWHLTLALKYIIDLTSLPDEQIITYVTRFRILTFILRIIFFLGIFGFASITAMSIADLNYNEKLSGEGVFSVFFIWFLVLPITIIMIICQHCCKK